MGNSNSSKNGLSTSRQIRSDAASRLKLMKIDKRGSSSHGLFRICSDERVEQVSNEEDFWLSVFKEDCSEVSEYCSWVKPVLRQLKKFKGYPITFYLREFTESGRPQRDQTNNRRGQPAAFSSDSNPRHLHRPQEVQPQPSPPPIKPSPQTEREGQDRHTTSDIKEVNENTGRVAEYKSLIKQSDLLAEEVLKTAEQTGNGGNTIMSAIGGKMNVLSFAQQHKQVQQAQPQQQQTAKNWREVSINDPFEVRGGLRFPRFGETSQASNSILQSFGISFTPKFLSSHTQVPEKDQLSDLKEYSEKITVLTRHLKDKSNVFCFFIEEFLDSFTEKFMYVGAEVSGDVSTAVTQEVQTFVRILTDAVITAYKIGEEEGENQQQQQKQKWSRINPLMQRDNVYNFIVSHLFRNSNLHKVLLRIFRHKHRQEEKKLGRACKSLKGVSIDRFNLDDKLCLNERTQHAFAGEGVTVSGLMNIEEATELTATTTTSKPEGGGRVEDDSSEVNPTEKSSEDRTAQKDEREKQQTKKSTSDTPPYSITSEPYFEAMKYLHRVKTAVTPMRKVRMILKASERIGTCIDAYYRKHKINQQPPVLEGNDILGVFAYFIARLGFSDLSSHLQIAYTFISDNLQSSVSGYYLTTSSCSINAVLEISQQQQQQNKQNETDKESPH